MLKSLLLFFSLGMALQASAACTAISSWPANPSTGQSVSFSLSGCNSSCYSTCLAYHASWNITCQGSFVINGVTYNGSATIAGTGFSAVFNSNTNVTVTFSTQGRCNSPCNAYLTKHFTVGTPPPPPITRPSTSLVPSSLTSVWETAGADKSTLPAVRECINVHTRRGVVSQYKDGYRVNITNLNTLINGSSTIGGTRVVYFQAAKYYFDKGEQIDINRNNLILSGEGANRTKFIIDNITTSLSANAKTFIAIGGRTRVGVTCLYIDTEGAFPGDYLHDRDENEHFKNEEIISISSSNNCWVSGVRVHRGYGSTVEISGGNNNEVTNCFFYDHWTLGGSGGTQGYSVNISNSDNNLIENNKMGLSRHNVIVQGRGNDFNNSTNENELSSGNVIAYNYLYEGLAKNALGPVHHPWNITFHGGGKNKNNLVEGNVCVDKIGVDDEKESNGRDNTFYKNLSKTQIEVEKGGNCFNEGQIYLGNAVYKRGVTDRYKIKSEDHLIRGNRKCNSSGGSCNTGTFNVGVRCGWPSNNQNTSLSSGMGQSCYLTSNPSFLTSFPYYNPETVLKAKNYTTAPDEGCFTCANVELPEIKDPAEPTDPKEPGDIAIKKGEENNKPATTELNQTEEVVAIAFPNPTSELVTIQLKGASITTPIVFQLHNVAGQLVGTTRVTLEEQNSFEYNVSALPRGLYIGTLIAEEQIYSVKIVKE